jgi:hypothetical protein
MKTLFKLLGCASAFMLVAACDPVDAPPPLKSTFLKGPQHDYVIVIDTARLLIQSEPAMTLAGDVIREPSGAEGELELTPIPSRGAEGVYVEIFNDEAVLRGFVATLEDRNQIAAKAQKTFNRCRVVDRLEIRRS